MKPHRNLYRTALMAVMLPAAFQARAQQDPLYSQYMFNTLAFNPAYAGSADVFTAMALSRHQWVGFAGAPTTQTLAVHSPLPTPGLAMGGLLIHDAAGPVVQNAAFVDLAYRLRTGSNGRLSFGLSGGVNLLNLDIASLATVDPDPHNANLVSKPLPNFGFGLYWHAERWYAGFSVPKLLEHAVGEDGAVVTAKEVRHWFLIGGFVVDLSDNVRFKPSVMLRAVAGAPLSADLNASFLLRDRIWLGAMWRYGNAFGLMAQYQVSPQLRAGYAFDMTTTRLGAYNAGTHELMVGYDFKFTKGRTVSPRFF
jgi:type IX secretion system PorP/SprF family membrane protein